MVRNELQTVRQLKHTAEALCRRAGEAGLFAAVAPLSPVMGAIRREARDWVARAEENMEHFTPGEALAIAGGVFDIVHRIAYSKPADRNFIDRYVLKALEASICGDRSVDEYELFRAISAALSRHDKTYFDKPLHWHSLTLDRWYKQFQYGACLDNLSEYDLVQRVSILLSEDLFAYEGENQENFKRSLYANYGPRIEASYRSVSNLR